MALRIVMLFLLFVAVGFVFAIMYIDMVLEPRRHRALHPGPRGDATRPFPSTCPRTVLHEIAELEVENFGKILSPEVDEHMRECRHGRRLPGVPAFEGLNPLTKPPPGGVTGRGIRDRCPYGHVYELGSLHCVECGDSYEES